MRVQVKVGNDIIVDSSKKKVAKVLEEPEQQLSKPEPKKEVTLDKVESRLNTTTDHTKTSEIPSDSIFNKKQELVKEPEEKSEIVVEYQVEENKSSSMTEELDSIISNYQEDDEYSEYEDYDQYLSNRQRSSKKHTKKSFRKGSSDFSDF